jgi:hypothetical protein
VVAAPSVAALAVMVVLPRYGHSAVAKPAAATS